MSRYKKIEFNDFSGGKGNDFLSEINKFYQSSKIEIDLETKKIKLVKTFDGSSVYGYWEENYLLSFDGAAYILYSNADGNPVLAKQINNGTLTTLYTFSAEANGGMEIYGFWRHKDILIVTFYDDTSAAVETWYSSVYTGSWTQSSKIIKDITSKGDFAYCITDDGSGNYHIEKTTDFATFSELADFLFTFFEIFTLRDFVYAAARIKKETKIFRLENDETLVEEEKTLGDMRLKNVLNNYAFFSKITKNNLIFYKFDGDAKEEFFKLPMKDLGTYVSSFFIESEKSGEYYAFIIHQPTANSDETLMYRVLEDGGFYKMNVFTGDLGLMGACIANENLYLFLRNGAYVGATDYEYILKNNYADIFEASGELETAIIDEGELAPKQIIARHDPILTGTSVKIYKKFDKASYELILTSNTVGAIKKIYTFPAGTKIDFAQFKIELITTDNTKTPENVQLKFLYLPLGLENAK